jgi:hypothetical protein
VKRAPQRTRDGSPGRLDNNVVVVGLIKRIENFFACLDNSTSLISVHFLDSLFVPSCANSQKIQSLLMIGYHRTTSFSMCCASATFSFDLLIPACFSDMKSKGLLSQCAGNLITSPMAGGGTPLSPSNGVVLPFSWRQWEVHIY